MKKLISTLLCALLLAAGLPGTALAAGGFDANLSADTIALFEAVGIVGDNDVFTTSQDLTVTRGEFARMLICMLGYRNSAADMTPTAVSYKDVSASHLYRSEILLATQLGLFGSRVSAWFYPDEPAETAWAAKAVTRLLGYGRQLERSSTVIASLGLLKGVAGKSGVLRRDDALRILRNALDVELLQIVGVSGGGLALDTVKDETILTVYFGVNYQEGVLTADPFTALTGERTRNGYVRFGDVTYESGNLETGNLVGANLRYYYRETQGEQQIIHFEKLKTTQIVLTADKAVYDYAQNRYTALNGDKTLTFPMELKTQVAYNGLPCFNKALMQPKTGQITLIDNDADGAYEVCIIREFSNLLVRSCNAAEGIIYDKLDSTRNLSTRQYDSFLLYSEKGEAVELSALRPDQILTVYESADKKSAEAYISGKSFSLQLQETDFAERILTVEGERYKLSADLRMSTDNLTVGQYYYFWFNHWNEVVYVSADWNYNAFYLMEATEEAGGLDPAVYVKGLSDSGEVLVYELADKVNWITYDSGRAAITRKEALTRLKSRGGLVNRQLLKISLNPAGKLREIVVPYEAERRSDVLTMNRDYPLIHMNYIRNEWPETFVNSSGYSGYNGGGFGYWLFFSPQAVELHVPLNTTADYAEKNVYLSTIRVKSTGDSRKPEVFDVYMSGKDGLAADYMILEVSESAASTDDGYFMDPYLVVSTASVMDETEGVNVTKLTLSNRNGSVSDCFAADEALLERENLEREARLESGLAAGTAVIPADKGGIEPGDILALEKDQSGKINRVRLVYDGAGQRDIHPVDGTVTGSTSEIVIGRVLRVDGSVAEIEATGDGIDAPSVLNVGLSSNLLEYNTRTRTVRRITAQELYPDDRLVIYLRYGVYYMAVVYRNR